MRLSKPELQSRIAKLDENLSCCKLCAFECGVNRNAGQIGKCGASADVYVSTVGKHFGEGPVLAGDYGAGAIFFSYCNASCVFCQNHQLSEQGIGEKISVDKLSDFMLSLQANGCVNVDLISPTHYVPQIVKAYSKALERGLTIPLLYNTNAYDSPAMIKLLDGIVDLYVPDLKFYDNELAKKYCTLKNYGDISRQNVAEMFRQVGLFDFDDRGIATKGLKVRHLVMPSMLDQAKSVLDFIYSLSPDMSIDVMCQYNPTFKAYEYEEINRPLCREEYEEIAMYLIERKFTAFSLNGFGYHDWCNPDYSTSNPFKEELFEEIDLSRL